MADMPSNPVAALESELAILVRRLEGIYRARAYPVERAQYLLLVQIESGARAAGEIAAILGLDHSTVVRQAAAVEALGLVERVPNPWDKRSVLVRLTPAGAEALAALRAQRQTRLAGILSGWEEADISQLATLTTRLNASLRRRGAVD